MVPVEAHFSPQHAVIGATPTDAFYGSTRRDELAWLELTLPKARRGAAAHAVPRRRARLVRCDRQEPRRSDQPVLARGSPARDLGPLPRRFAAATVEELIATVRVLAPALVEQARAWALPTAPSWALVLDQGAEELDEVR